MTITQAVIEFMTNTLKQSGLIVMTPREFLLALLRPGHDCRDGWVSAERIEAEFVRYGLLSEQARVLLETLQQESVIDFCLIQKDGVGTPSYRRKLRPGR